MDPRGATSPVVDDPRGALEELSKRTKRGFPNTFAARRYTEEHVAATKAALADVPVGDDQAIVVFGSWARGELTEGSDHDWALLCAKPFAAEDERVRTAVAAAERVLGGDGRKPGSQAVFGVPFAAGSLVRNIGLEADSNRNLTRRMLLLLESRELAGEIHREWWLRVLDRYLNYAVKDFRPPRFLLNDLVRYWRTIGVDFEGKHRDTRGNDPKWVARNAKLRTARKLLFAGGLLPVLLCESRGKSEMRDFLSTWLTAPPTDRIAAAFLHFNAIDEGARALAAYDDWMAIQRSKKLRNDLAKLTFATRGDSELFEEVRDIGRRFERALLALLFDTPLSPLARQYLVF